MDNDLAVTYEALETRANRLARLLRQHARRGDRIGLLLPKSPAAIAGMLASLKAGAIYVPLDPESPGARLEKILYAAECRVLLASAHAVPLLRQLMPRLEQALRPHLVWIGDVPADTGYLEASAAKPTRRRFRPSRCPMAAPATIRPTCCSPPGRPARPRA